MVRSNLNASASSNSCGTTPTLSEILQLDKTGRDNEEYAANREFSENETRSPSVAALKRIKASLNPDSQPTTRRDAVPMENLRVEYPYYDGEIELTPEKVVVTPPPDRPASPPTTEDVALTSQSKEPEISTLNAGTNRANGTNASTQERSFKDIIKVAATSAARDVERSASTVSTSELQTDASRPQYQAPGSAKSNAPIFRYCVDLINSRESTYPQTPEECSASETLDSRDVLPNRTRKRFGLALALTANNERQNPAVFNESSFLNLVPPPAGVSAK